MHRNTYQVNPDYYPFQTYHYSPVPVSVYPPFSKLVRQKSGRPVVAPLNRKPGFGGFKDGQQTDPVKGGSSTTEAPVEQQTQEQEQEQEQEQSTEPTAVKGYYSVHF